MRITNNIRKGAFDKLINYKHYQPVVENKTDCVIFCHGRGERGAVDGSQIDLLEKLSGWPKFAKGKRPGSTTETGSIEYPFNIIAPQVAVTYNEILYWVVQWVVLKFGYKNIVVAGISMGNYAIYDMMKWDIGNHIKGFVACCGSQELAELPQTKKINGIAWHGTADTTVSYSNHKAFADAYNSAGGQLQFNSLEGVGHNAWDYAFKANPAEDKSLEFVNGIFADNKPQIIEYNFSELNLALDKAISVLQALKK
jgi:predicted esterase